MGDETDSRDQSPEFASRTHRRDKSPTIIHREASQRFRAVLEGQSAGSVGRTDNGYVGLCRSGWMLHVRRVIGADRKCARSYKLAEKVPYLKSLLR